ncbi:MAG: OmpA family protein [Candidatus Puniceispirillaceae bacterium]
MLSVSAHYKRLPSCHPRSYCQSPVHIVSQYLCLFSGHADERRTQQYNLALGHLSASAVADYMLARSIDDLRIKKVLHGKERPLLKGSNEEAWAKNRKVEINDE